MCVTEEFTLEDLVVYRCEAKQRGWQREQTQNRSVTALLEVFPGWCEAGQDSCQKSPAFTLHPLCGSAVVPLPPLSMWQSSERHQRSLVFQCELTAGTGFLPKHNDGSSVTSVVQSWLTAAENLAESLPFSPSCQAGAL